MPQDTLVGIIEMFLEMTDEEFVCVQMIYERALHHENCKPKQYESREITSIMRLKFAEQWEEVKSHRFSFKIFQCFLLKRNVLIPLYFLKTL